VRLIIASFVAFLIAFVPAFAAYGLSARDLNLGAPLLAMTTSGHNPPQFPGTSACVLPVGCRWSNPSRARTRPVTAGRFVVRTRAFGSSGYAVLFCRLPESLHIFERPGRASGLFCKRTVEGLQKAMRLLLATFLTFTAGFAVKFAGVNLAAKDLYVAAILVSMMTLGYNAPQTAARRHFPRRLDASNARALLPPERM